MIEAFLPSHSNRLVVYLKPINVRWGAKKLGALCREVMCVEPDDSTCFLFVNGRRDTLVLYFLDFDGEQTLIKKLDRGSFLLPTLNEGGAPFVVMRPAMLPRLLRT